MLIPRGLEEEAFLSEVASVKALMQEALWQYSNNSKKAGVVDIQCGGNKDTQGLEFCSKGFGSYREQRAIGGF